MPPKSAKSNQPNKKTVEKAKAKIVEDKTFGLKNKKGNKQQKFIQQVEKTVMHSGKSAKDVERQNQLKKKDEMATKLDELNALFKPVIAMQKIGKDVDPKSVLCVFFKQGQCTKGDKCKFSHDLNVERRSEKRNLYAGGLPGEPVAGGNEMDGWDQAQLEDVVSKKHGEKNKSLPPTSIICKHFLDAVENNKYGWFWECPGGEKCHYVHALPPGFILKKDQKKMDEQKEEVSLEELIEKERMALGPNQTRVTLNTFIAWKRRKRAEKVKQMETDKAKRSTDFKQGKTGGISGRELFEFNPDLIKEMDDDDGGELVDSRLREGEEGDTDGGPIHEINFEEYNCDNYAGGDDADSRVQEPNNNHEDEEALGACGGSSSQNKSSSKSSHHNNLSNGNAPDTGGVAIDEDLFNADDLDDLEEDLENLDIQD